MSNVTDSGIAVDAPPSEAARNSDEDTVATPNGERPNEDKPELNSLG